MNRKYLLIALVLLLLPIFARGVWHYRGAYTAPEITVPDYVALSAPLAIPPSAPLAAPQPDSVGKTVLLDFAHANNFQLTEIESLSTAIAARGARLETISDASLATRLKYASAYIVISPLVAFEADEMRAINAFVQSGGRLLVITDPTNSPQFYDFFTGVSGTYPDVIVANSLLAAHGLSFANDYLYNTRENEGNFRNVIFKEFADSPLTENLVNLIFYGAHGVSVTRGTALASGSDGLISSLTDRGENLTSLALSEGGNVLALGDTTFLSAPYHQVGDNEAFIHNLAGFLLASQRTRTLSEYPYIFTGEIVSLLPTNVQLSANLLGILAQTQSSLRFSGVSMDMVSEAPQTGDLLVLGLFGEDEILQKYSGAFKMEMPADSDYIILPGFGKVGRTGNAILLFSPEKTGNTLTILADDQINLVTMLSLLNSGDLSACVLQDNLAVCGVGFGDEFGNDEEFFEFEEEPNG
jgi:hypothetical protein